MSEEATVVAAAEPQPSAQPTDPTAGQEQVTQPEVKPEKTFTQAELDEILEKRLSKERRKREELNRRLVVTEELVLKGKPAEAPKAPEGDGAPVREKFDSYEAFLEAKAEWKAEQAVERRMAKVQEEQAKASDERKRGEVQEGFRATAEKLAKEIPDFNEVMENSEAAITRTMSQAIMEAGEVGVRVAYHLAKNPDEAQRIAALSVSRQAAEIGKLEAKLASEPAPKKPSKAPDPITPVSGKRTSSADDMPDPQDTKAWVEWRQRQLAAKRSPSR